MSNKQVLFIQGGGGQKDYEADKKLVDSLQQSLGEAYRIHYPNLPNESVPDVGRIQQIGNELSRITDELILVGHSLGASMLLKYVSETEVQQKLTALFLVSTPFWSGDEDWKAGFKLAENFANTLSKDIPFFFTTVRMMRRCQWPTLPCIGKNFPGPLSANYPAAVIN